MEFKTIDKKKVIDAHKGDYKDYQDYIAVIRSLAENSLGSVNHDAVNIPKNPYYRVDKFSDIDCHPVIEITPGFADEEHALYRVGIKLHSSKIDLDYVKKITKERLGDCKSLKKVTIETYF